jgi:beta-lactam-binding protein with PASTA domain
MGPVNSDTRTSKSFRQRATTLLLMMAVASLSRAQAPSSRVHPPFQAIDALPKIQVLDVRGQRAEEAMATLRKEGLAPGKTSSAAGPGIVGTVSQQDPPAGSFVVKGTTFNLVLVAPRAGATNDGDQEFSTQVPRLIGLTPNQASALLERNRLTLGSALQGNGKGPEATIYDQRPPAGSWARIWSRIDVTIVQPTKPAGTGGLVWVLVPNLIGQPQKVAEQTLRDHNLMLGGISLGVASAPAGTVFGQLPAPNTRVVEGSQVELRIAKAQQSQPPTVTVPDLVHQNVASARSLVAQKGLQLGRVTSDESNDPANSVLSQSPVADTQVERGSSVDVQIAQPIPPVTVPNLVQHEEAEASTVLQNVGLRLGNVDEKESDAATGTILLQKPSPGEQVLKGSAVDVTLSRQILTQLTVLVNPANPASGQRVQFHAHLDPAQQGMQYRFFFGDNTDSGWLPSSNTTHVYEQGGHFQVYAVATRGPTTTTSEQVTITIPSFPWGLATAVLAGLLILGGGAVYLQRWTNFRRWIRVAPKMDAGTQSVCLKDRGANIPCARIRLVHDAGKSTVELKEDKQERRVKI